MVVRNETLVVVRDEPLILGLVTLIVGLEALVVGVGLVDRRVGLIVEVVVGVLRGWGWRGLVVEKGLVRKVRIAVLI